MSSDASGPSRSRSPPVAPAAPLVGEQLPPDQRARRAEQPLGPRLDMTHRAATRPTRAGGAGTCGGFSKSRQGSAAGPHPYRIGIRHARSLRYPPQPPAPPADTTPRWGIRAWLAPSRRSRDAGRVKASGPRFPLALASSAPPDAPTSAPALEGAPGATVAEDDGPSRRTEGSRRTSGGVEAGPGARRRGASGGFPRTMLPGPAGKHGQPLLPARGQCGRSSESAAGALPSRRRRGRTGEAPVRACPASTCAPRWRARTSVSHGKPSLCHA